VRSTTAPECVDWFNLRWIMEPTANMRPVEAEKPDYAALNAKPMAA